MMRAACWLWAMLALAALTTAMAMATATASHAAPPPGPPRTPPTVKVPKVVDPHEGVRAAIPILRLVKAHDALVAWERVKAGGSVKAQLDAITKQALPSSMCTDLVDFRDLVSRGSLGGGLGFRDNIRGRSWGRAALALMVREAWKRFRLEHPTSDLAIGDVSQPGCGQINHGVLVQTLTGVAARALVAATTLVEGVPLVVDMKRASDYPWEADRFAAPTQRVRVETRVLARSKDDTPADAYTVRLGRTRYAETEAPSADETLAFEREVEQIARSGLWVYQQKFPHPPAPGSTAPVASAATPAVAWRTHWVSPGTKRQLIAWTLERPSRRFRASDASVIRLASWQDKKPGSLPNEVRWERAAPGTRDRPGTWHRWAALYEAGHVTHLAGIDADLSYIMRANQGQFAVDLDNIDALATFRWFELADEAARALGTPIEAILVDAKIKAYLREHLPMKGKDGKQRSRIWGLIRVAGGHDGHHHLRMAEPSAAKEKAARKALGLD